MADADLDRWLAEQRTAMVNDLTTLLDIEAGLRDALVLDRHAALVEDLRDTLDVDAGLAAIVPAAGPPTTQEPTERRTGTPPTSDDDARVAPDQVARASAYRAAGGDIPGGAMASRPVQFIWLLDCSSSMAGSGKISVLNAAMREAIPAMRRVAEENLTAQLLVRVLTFSSGARWHVEDPTAIEKFTWSDVEASGVTDLGAALKLVAKVLNTPPMPQRALRPVLVLISDGQPTDNWRSGLSAVDATPWGKRAVRVAIGIGGDADKKMLKEFLGNPEQEVIEANNPEALAVAIRWTSTAAVKVASTPQNDSGTGGLNLQIPPTVRVDSDDIW